MIHHSKTESFFINLLKFRWSVLFIYGVISLYGIFSFHKIKVDAIPDIANKQVIVNTKTMGIDPAIIEKSITYPIEAELYGIQGLEEMRSLSKFGLSQIILIFRDDVDIHFARNQVLQRISTLKDQLPPNISPTIAPITSGIGEIIIYRIFNSKNVNDTQANREKNLMELRAIQEFQIARELKRIPGVAEVDTIGGFERQIHLNLNPDKITEYGMTAKKLIEQIQSVGENFGGGYIEKDNEQKIVRTFANIKNQDDVMAIPVKVDYTGKAVPLSHIVEVRQDFSQRLGASSFRGEEAVIGTVMLQSGENSKEVLIKVKNEIEKLNKLSPDIKIELLYDRQFLIDSTIKTVLKNLGEGIFLIILVLCLTLGTFKSGIIVASCLVFSILILSVCMNVFGISANLMSLGAIDFGLLVDSSVVLVEYIIFQIHFFNYKKTSKEEYSSDLVNEYVTKKIEFIAKSCAEVFKPIFVGILIIILVYIPILMFGGIEGKTFRPMALNVIIAMTSSLLIAFTLMPIFCYFFINKASHKENFVLSVIYQKYKKVISYALMHENLVIIFCITFFTISSFLFFKLDSDFLPDLNEGDIVLTVTLPEGASLTITKDSVIDLEKKLLANKEIDKTFSRIGTSQSGLDPMPQNVGDLFIVLKDSEKTSAPELAKKFLQQAKQNCEICELSLSQPIKMRFNEMLEGSRADLSLKIFGEDLEKLISITESIKKIFDNNNEVKSAEKDFVNSIRKGSFINIIPDYDLIAKHQINILDVNSELSNAMVGVRIGTFYTSEIPIAIVLHLNEQNRNKIDSIKNIPITLKDGGSFALKKVANVVEKQDITSIPRNFGKRYSSLSIYLNHTNYSEFIKNAEEKIIQNKLLPEGYSLEWGGRYKNLNNAKKQIFLVIPFIMFLIGVILYKMFGKMKKVLIIFSTVPFALSGAVLLLYIFDISITISVYIGFIALIGIGLLNSIILINTFNKTNNIEEACISRFRPILMTALVASLGFLPMAFAHGIGAEVQQPIAVTVIGGIICATFSTLILSPVLLKKFKA